VEATEIVGAGAHDVRGEAGRPGLVQHDEKFKGDVIIVFSYLTGEHREDRDRLFSELHSRRTRGNRTELHPKRAVKHQNKGLKRWATSLLTVIQNLSWCGWTQRSHDALFNLNYPVIPQAN